MEMNHCLAKRSVQRQASAPPVNPAVQTMDVPMPLVLGSLAVSVVVWCLLLRHRSGDGGKKRPLPPGPRGWPVLGNLPQMGTHPHQTMCALAKEYGPMFRLRFGSAEVVVASSARVAAQFLRAHDANFSSRPPNTGAELVAYNYQDMVFAPYGSLWRALRKLCALHLFCPKALNDLRAVREAEVALMVRDLVRHDDDAVVPLGQVVYVCAANALARATVGRRLFAVDDKGKEEAREFMVLVMEMMQVGGVLKVGDFVPALAWFDPQGIVGKMKRMHRRYDDMMNRIIRERDAAEEGKDLLCALLARMREQESLPEGEDSKINETNVKALLLDLFTAGTDTTSSTVEWALAELIRHPDVLNKVQKELDVAVGRDRLVSEADLPRLTYLTAVIKETFRLHPSTPLALPRVAAEECEVDGFRIPAGTTLHVNVWAIARDPVVWPEPLKFRPDRFLPGGAHAGVDVKGSDFELIPFGAGRRICAGLNWGLRMVTLMTAALVHAIDWDLADGITAEKLDMEEVYGLTLQRAVPLMVRPTPRLLSSAYAA